MDWLGIEFPVGTGIYRYSEFDLDEVKRVPCRYRDIPLVWYYRHVTTQRSLWVQGYTEWIENRAEELIAFPVGTGIYRQ